MRQHSVRRLGALLGGASLLIGLASCEVKDTSFFVVGTGTPGNTGSLGVLVTGTPAGASVHITGPGTDKTATVGDQGASFQDLAFGQYTVTVSPPSGYTCTPTTRSVTLSASAPDGSATFACEPMPGTVTFTSTGLTGSTTFGLSLMDGTTLTGQFGSSGLAFTNVHPGAWSWELGATVGYTCTPMSGAFTLDPGGSYTQAIDCASQLGTLSMAVTGTGMTHALNYSGPQSGSVTAGETPVTANVTPGQYTITFVTSPVGYACTNPSPVTVTAGQVTNVTLACTANPGTVNVSVSGATANVSYTGPSSGMVSAGNSPVPVTGLAAGNYTFTITEPAGFTCTPSSIPVVLAPGGTENAAFACSGIVMQPTAVTFGIGDIQPGAGAVASGSYPVGLYDGGTQVGTTSITVGGGNTFIGFSPTRLGLGSGGFFMMPLTGHTVSGSPFAVDFLQFCGVNGAISGAQPFSAWYLDASMSPIGSLDLTTSSGCVEGAVPAGAESVKFQWTFGGFIDFNGIRIRHN